MDRPESALSVGIVSAAPRRPWLPRRLGRQALANLFTLFALGAWWAYSLYVPAYLVPGPGAVFARMGQLVVDPVLALQLATSVGHVLSSIALAFVVGCALAFVSAFAPALTLLIDSVVTPFLNSFSGVGWLFLALLWFGLTSQTVVFAVTMILVPFSIINVRTGFQQLDRELGELGSSLTRSRRLFGLKIVLPQLVPYFFAALRTSFGVAWKVVLVCELFGGNAGAGYLLNIARQELDTETIFAIILFIVAFVALAEQLIFRPMQRSLDRRYDRG